MSFKLFNPGLSDLKSPESKEKEPKLSDPKLQEPELPDNVDFGGEA